MAQHRSGWERSLRSLFGMSNGGKRRTSSPRRHRFRVIERLEERALLTTTVFIDFGEGLDRHLVLTAGELRRELIGPDFVPAISAFADAELIEMTPLRLVFQQQQIDFNDDGRAGDINDYLEFRQSVVSIVQRQFAPFDVNVEVVAARTTAEIKAVMTRNAGDPTGQFDAYVWAGGLFGGFTGQPAGVPFWLGIASAVDLLQNLQNTTDEVVVLDGESMLTTARQAGWNLATSYAFVISHEAGHSLGLRHISGGGPLPAFLTIDQNLLSGSEIETEGGGSFDSAINVSHFTRYPLMMGDGNADQNILLNSFEKLANDPDIGLRRGAPQYVTGTGAFDRITITRLSSTTARVTVEPFRNETFAEGSRITIGTGGSFSYTLAGLNSAGIVVEAGRSQDEIVVDGLLGVPVVVRGGQGLDQLRVTGVPAANATFIPDQSYRVVPGNENYFGRTFLDERREFFSYSGTILAGGEGLTTNIRYEEFDDGGVIHFDNFGSASFNGSAGSDFLTVNNAAAGANEVDGVMSGVGFPNMRYSNVRSVVINTGAPAATDAVTINTVNAPGLALLTVLTGAGDDFINLTTGTVRLPVAGGGMVFNFGQGRDTLNAVGDVDWTLSDLTLTTGIAVGGGVALQELLGETVNLVGGPSNNVFRTSGWSGIGRIIGQGGTDTIEIIRDLNFSFGENFVNMLGVGGFLLTEVENLRLTGGPGANTFFDYGWNGTATLDGGLGAIDMIAGIRDTSFRLTDTTYHAGGSLFSSTVTLTNIELASLNGGAGFNQFDVSARTRPAAIIGGGGQDVLIHSRNADVTLTNSSLTVSGPASNFFSLSGVELAYLTGGGGDNTFTISQWAGDGFMVGGGGNDTFNIATGSLDAVAGFWNILGGTGADRIFVNDLLGSGGNYLVMPNTVTMAPGSNRRFGAIFFDGTTENLRLNANNGPNRIDVTPSLGTTFTIDGNAPAPPSGDTLVLHTAFTGMPNGPMDGPGPGQRRFTFNAGHRDVIFEDIEQLLGAQ